MDTRILIVDDDEAILYAFQEVFRREGYKSIIAKNGEEGLEKFRKEKPDIIFMDITMPKLDGLETLRLLRQENSTIPVIMITGFGTMQTAVRAMQLGAFDYVTKPLDVHILRNVTRKAIHSIESVPHTENIIRNTDVLEPRQIVGNSNPIQEIFKLIGSLSMTPNQTTVFITGESGTGKELVARAIHANSPNSHAPFIAINSTALPENLLESELFGHEKGAFTGAVSRKIGKFEAAQNGTIFLDEIGDLSIAVQQKLLRAIQEREFERLGGNETIPVHARFIAATNREVESDVKKGNFREDLYFRLNVVRMYLPPLRDRKDDIPVLAHFFLSKYNVQLNKSIKGFSSSALALLASYPFPGNIREMENLIERAVMLTKGGVILPDAFGELTADRKMMAANPSFPIISAEFAKARDYVLDLFEQQFVRESLTRYRGNVSLAAEKSDMTRQNFQRLMKKHGIEAEPYRRNHF